MIEARFYKTDNGIIYLTDESNKICASFHDRPSPYGVLSEDGNLLCNAKPDEENDSLVPLRYEKTAYQPGGYAVNWPGHILQYHTERVVSTFVLSNRLVEVGIITKNEDGSFNSSNISRGLVKKILTYFKEQKK
jgi:hypothetical protein